MLTISYHERLKCKVRSILKRKKWRDVDMLASRLLKINSHKELMKLFQWSEEPIIDQNIVDLFEYKEDLNERRRRDAESILTVCRNLPKNSTILEIGTANGVTTASLSANAPSSTIYTVNISPEEAVSGAGGEKITGSFSKDVIGKYYRDRCCDNVHQIYANTASWKPDVGMVDFAFIDGCHDTNFIVNDTLLILEHMNPGGFICWHDCHPTLRNVHDWIESACSAMEILIAANKLEGNIYWVKDSWVFIYQVPD